MQPGVLLILKLRAKLVEALFRQDVERAKAAEPTGDEPEQNRQLTTDAFLPTSLGTILMDKSYDKPREDGILVRIWHPFFLEYCRPIPLGFGLLGLVFFVEFARSWTVGVYLPHPVIGAWVAWEAFSRAYKAWLRHRVLEVEITTNGMRVIDAADTRLIPWPEVYQLYVDRHQARFFHEGRPVVFERDWPGFRRVVDALIARAGLVSRPRKLALADLTGLASHSYERG